MRGRTNSICKYLLIFWLLLSMTAGAAEIRVAVASNFIHTLDALGAAFKQSTGHEITAIPGSTGKLYAQISNGAPFDIFLAADSRRPELLEKSGKAKKGSRFTYAKGRLALWSAIPGIDVSDPAILASADFEHLAIANPRLAPYGRAAKETLEKLALWQQLQPRMVRGENIAQAYRYVHDCVAELGLVALSQLHQQGNDIVNSVWIVPQEFHAPIEQQVVRLSDQPAAKEFMDWLQDNEAENIIRQHGYEVR